MHEVANFLRHQYSLTYTPSNHTPDGKYRKVKVELVAPDGSPLIVLDQKGKKQKICGLRARRVIKPPRAA